MISLLLAAAYATCGPNIDQKPNVLELVDAQCQPLKGEKRPDFVYVRMVVYPDSICCAMRECSSTEPSEGHAFIFREEAGGWVQLDQKLEDDQRAECEDRPRRLDLRGLKPGTYRLAAGDLLL